MSNPLAPAPLGIIPLSVPELRGNEWKYLKECLDTGWVSSAGPFVERFEQAVAAYLGCRHAVATASGTAALHIALLVAGVQPDDEVLIPALTFIAPANAVRYVGAWPRFIDVTENYWQMDPETVVNFVEQECRGQRGALRNRVTGRRVSAILPVHILGHPVDMGPIAEVGRKYGLALVEDATESLGARYHSEMVGRLGDIAGLSFNGNKVITTGGGGMIVTNNDTWAARARYLADQAKDDPFEYIHATVGYNYRLSNLHAALGCAQVEKIEEFIGVKRQIATRYASAFNDLRGVTLMPEAPWARSTFWLYTVLIDPAETGVDRRRLAEHVLRQGIQVRPLWQPLHRSPAHREAGSRYCPVAEEIWKRALSLPSSVGLTEAQQERVIEAVRSGLGQT